MRVLHGREDQPLFDRVDPITHADLERAAIEIGRQRRLLRQPNLRDPLTVGHDVGAVNRIRQLADITGPVVALQPIDGGRRQCLARAALLVELGKKVIGEELDVLAALA